MKVLDEDIYLVFPGFIQSKNQQQQQHQDPHDQDLHDTNRCSTYCSAYQTIPIKTSEDIRPPNLSPRYHTATATKMDAIATGLATPPIHSAAPLVFITGSPTANKQCVAECLALLLGDNKSILIDHPFTTTWTPPPPSLTPPPQPQDPSSTSRTSSARGRTNRPSRLPPPRGSTTRRRAVSYTPSTSPFPDPLLAILSANPARIAVLTDSYHACTSTLPQPTTSPPATVAALAASRTGRPFVTVRLSPPSAAPQVQLPQTLVLPDDGEPHETALRIVEFVSDLAARRRSAGDIAHGRLGGAGSAATSCVCGVITPALTPSEEREMHF